MPPPSSPYYCLLISSSLETLKMMIYCTLWSSIRAFRSPLLKRVCPCLPRSQSKKSPIGYDNILKNHYKYYHNKNIKIFKTGAILLAIYICLGPIHIAYGKISPKITTKMVQINIANGIKY